MHFISAGRLVITHILVAYIIIAGMQDSDRRRAEQIWGNADKWNTEQTLVCVQYPESLFNPKQHRINMNNEFMEYYKDS